MNLRAKTIGTAICLGVVAGAAFLWAAPSTTDAVEDLKLAPPADSRVAKTRETIAVGGETRRYVLSRPAVVDAAAHYPLIVAYHGYRGDVKAWMHEITSFDAHIAEKKFIVAYPEGPIGWGPSLRGRDLAFFDALVAALKKQFPVDEQRIYVVGHSNGGAFASFVLFARDDLIAAGAVQAGVGEPGNLRLPVPARKAPLLLIWGEHDHLPALKSEADFGEAKILRSLGFSIETMILPNWGHPWGGVDHKVEERVLAFFEKHPLAAASP